MAQEDLTYSRHLSSFGSWANQISLENSAMNLFYMAKDKKVPTIVKERQERTFLLNEIK